MWLAVYDVSTSTGGGLVARDTPRGFTLIELVVVIAIILILGAMLLPVFEQATKQAEAICCLSNMRNIGYAALMYADDYGQQYPPAIVEITDSICDANCWDKSLFPYLRSELIFVCPADETPTPGPSWTCSIPHSYGINLDVAMVGGYAGAALRCCQVPRPGRTILFFELEQENSYGWRQSSGNMSQYVAARHNEGANFVFCAGNAKWIRLELTDDLWEP